LKEEFGPSAITQDLKSFLEDSGWWLRAANALKTSGLLSPECAEPPCYRDICMWLPCELWGTEALPPCLTCLTSNRLGVHCWRDNHAGRRIVALDTFYVAISRRRICHRCEDAAAAVKTVAKVETQTVPGLCVVTDRTKRQREMGRCGGG